MPDRADRGGTQFRAEQAKMNDLQAQLDKLDGLLAGPVSQ
jgi:hypothetical protein